MLNKTKTLISFIVSTFLLLKTRNRILILINQNDLSLNIKGIYISPLAESLSIKLNKCGVKTIILLIDTKIKNNRNTNYKNIGSFINVLIRLKLKQISIWKCILKINNPSALILVDWDSNANIASNIINKKLFYLQHGVICEDHMYFGKKKLNLAQKLELPFGFISWNENSSENFKNLCATYAIGNLWLQRFLSIESDEFIESLKNQKINFLIDNLERKNILLTLTNGNPEIKFLDETLINLIKKTSKKYNWLIRLHPITYNNIIELNEFELYLVSNFEKSELKYIEWKQSTNLPLPLLLSKCNLHITIESSSIIEASIFNIKSLVYNYKVVKLDEYGKSYPPYGGPSYFLYERNIGYVDIYDKEMCIENWIEKNIDFNNVNTVCGNYDEEWGRFLISIEKN
jgi:hypothetical protein